MFDKTLRSHLGNTKWRARAIKSVGWLKMSQIIAEMTGKSEFFRKESNL